MKDALKVASLFRSYRYQFAIGAAINSWNTDDETYSELICRHFNSITAENEMKPANVLDYEKTLAIGDNIHTAQNFEIVDKLLTFARDHGIQVRFHVLCWHGQTPFWFYMENWENVDFETMVRNQFEGPFASREVMLARQEAYIHDVMTHVNTCFPGVVYCWDVVNEAMEPDQGAPNGYRSKSPWYKVLGEEFIPAAFRAARKYQAPGQLLFYNDYNCYHEQKLHDILEMLKKLQAEKLVDGMGMQAHLMMETPAVEECEKAARAYADLGLALQVTELDIHCPDGSEEGQRKLAEKYGAYFDMLVRLKKDGINVNSATFWGLTDQDSWLPGFRKMDSFPLLFTGEMQAKDAFDAVTEAAEKYDIIRLNQVGYAVGLPQKVAVLTEEPVILENAAGEVLKTFAPKTEIDPSSGDRVAMLDLSPLPAGEFTLRSGTVSRKLTVKERPWKDVTNALIKGLYYQRCGMDLEEKYAGVYAHPACHTAPARLWEDKETVVSIPGGWHDAGDFGKYVTPGAVTVGHMLYAHVLFPDGCGDELNIPESGNGVPDILNEARWELEWILKMQREDGAFYHKLTKDHFAPFIMPQDDRDQEYATPISSLATAGGSAVCALAARVYRPYDESFASRLLAAAIKGWNWLQANLELLFANPEGVRTGQYGDRSDVDERFWAACELFAATGEEQYKTAIGGLYSDELNLTQFGWADVSGMGALSILFELKETIGEGLYARVKENFLSRAEQALETVKASGYETALRPENYIWGSVLPLMNNGIAMIAASLLTGREDLRNGALGQVHYALGLNSLDISFITGFGEKRVMFPHHRPSGADGIQEPVPGLISGGPNGRWNYGMTKKILPEGIAPAKSFLDETLSADTNEIAIYWNSPAIFVFAYFNSLK